MLTTPLVLSACAVATMLSSGPEMHAVRYASASRIGCSLLNVSRTVDRVPFRVVRNRIVVPVYVNDRGPYHFMVDIGATGLARVDTSLAEHLELPASAAVPNFDGVSERLSRTVRIETLRLGSLTRRATSPVIARGFNQGRVLADATGFDGVLGLGFFSDVLLTIDYGSRELMFEEGALDARQSDVVRYRGSGFGLVLAPVVIGGHPSEALIDTGSSGQVLLPTAWSSRLGMADFAPGGTARRSNSEHPVQESRTPISVRIGGSTLVTSRSHFADVVSEVNIGNELLLLSRARLTLDQRQRLLRVVVP